MEISKGTTRNNLSYLLTALLPNKEGKLLAGMSGKASLNTHSVSTLSQGQPSLKQPFAITLQKEIIYG